MRNPAPPPLPTLIACGLFFLNGVGLLGWRTIGIIQTEIYIEVDVCLSLLIMPLILGPMMMLVGYCPSFRSIVVLAAFLIALGEIMLSFATKGLHGDTSHRVPFLVSGISLIIAAGTQIVFDQGYWNWVAQRNELYRKVGNSLHEFPSE